MRCNVFGVWLYAGVSAVGVGGDICSLIWSEGDGTCDGDTRWGTAVLQCCRTRNHTAETKYDRVIDTTPSTTRFSYEHSVLDGANCLLPSPGE